MFISMMRHWKALKETLLLLAVYSATASVTALAQDNPLGQPLLDANGQPRESAFIHIPLREDDAQYADLDGIWMKEVLNEVIQFSQDDKENGNLFWGRNLGTESHVKAQEWAENYFHQLVLTFDEII